MRKAPREPIKTASARTFRYEGTPFSLLPRFAPYRHWQRIFRFSYCASLRFYSFVEQTLCQRQKWSYGMQKREKLGCIALQQCV
jgi:hypothetical protein